MSDDVRVKNFLRILIPGQEPNIDIVAVHGLNPKNKDYHAERTWMSGEKLWLRDFLPHQLPRARILLFGYNSNVGIQSSSAGVREQAQNLLNRLRLERQGFENRPIIFIAHSLGGILVKEALVQAKLGEAYYSIYTATFGIAFFGTPHRGSPLARVGDVVAKVVRTVLRNPSNTFLNALKKDDLYANELSSNFQQLLENYRYLNFYETLPFKSFGMIVEKNSATFGLPGSRETAIALNADHEEICRYASEYDEDYKHISALIVELADSATKEFGEKSLFGNLSGSESTLVADESDPAFFVMPYARNPGFITRKPIVQQLRDRITPIGESHSRVALFGLGGVGKSQIAIEFAYQIRAECPQTSVFWIHASSIERFRKGYYNILSECDIPEVDTEKYDKLIRVRDWLENEHKDWLMIIDNADEASLFLSSGELSHGKLKKNSSTAELSILDYLPKCVHGSILITTRNRAAGVKFTQSCPADLVEVQTMTETESKNLIKSTVTDHIPTELEMHQLSDLLDHLPLALVQASAFMQENMLSVGEYIDLYHDSDETRMDLLCESFETLGRDTEVPNAVATTLIVSINQIKERDPKAIEVLSLMAFLDQHDIAKSLVKQQVKRPLELTKALGTLKSFSLIMANEQRASFSLHRLVQLAMRKWLIVESAFEDKAIQAMDVVAELFPNATHENWAICAAYLPHAQTVLQFIPELDGKLLRRKLYLQEGIAFYLWSQGYCKEAEELDLLIVEANKREYGMEHPETLESLGGLASTYQDQGRWSEAEKLDLHLVETWKKLRGPTHHLTLTSMSNLAKIYQHQGRLREAESLALHVMETRKSVFGTDHESSINSMANFGHLCIDLDRLEQAEELIKYAWNWRKNKFGVDDEATLSCAATLGAIYCSQHKLEQAEQWTLDTLHKMEEKMGPNHPNTLMNKGNLASVYKDKKEWDKAEELILEVIKEVTKQVGPTHFDTLVHRQLLSLIYWGKGLIEQAEKMEEDIFREALETLGPNHYFTLTCMHLTAITRKCQNREIEAVNLMVEVVNGRENMLGPYHESTLESLGELVQWCGEDKAIEMLLDTEECS
ncbi:hypothetical protein ASPWEDRAFT_731886 [Aspergillus wentii DTO 134E9]|uniref:Uncharacterized protein n=1 Tax=Aspergillus wentii DTO 134E9 TaxID=1073089 RepID=A0A1L9S260_ASPWE|nr:uncharacterized protein ASPWEDRAFT_731886 [Aspergillus wentii DTO 134E9]OJJ41230.1 hypothetical protein ASPWEDRAFT_731886 [Aspergillus wentii DTO 134E9]